MAHSIAKPGKHYKLQLTCDKGIIIANGVLHYWAEGGMVCMEDDGTGEFYVVTVRDWLLRARAISAMARRANYQERVDLQRTVENMVACAKEARTQGDPLDPKVQEWYRKHKPRNHILVELPGAAKRAGTKPGKLLLPRL